jgi:hypothetical protein
VADVPEAMWALPPSHFLAAVAPVWGPVVPLADVALPVAAQLDRQYGEIADHRWEVLGERVTGEGTDIDRVEAWMSWYDQPKARLIHWARGGGIQNLERGLRQAAEIRNEYRRSGWKQWHLQDVLSMSMAYWWTGRESFREAALQQAQGSLNSWMAPPDRPGYDEGRISGRNLGWALSAWLLGYRGPVFSDGMLTPEQWMDGLAALHIASQQPNGAWFEAERDSQGRMVHAGIQSNFMAALRAYYLGLYVDYRGPGQVTGVADAMVRNARFMQDQYDAQFRTWHYWSDWVRGDAEVSLENMRNLALLQSTQQVLAYRYAGDAGFLSQVDEAWVMALERIASNAIEMRSAPAYGLKIFTEGYYTWPWVLAKRLGY